MKEELIKYVMEEADRCYSDDFPINSIEVWIREFFDQYQPERLNPENTILNSYYGNKFCGGCKEENCICDSLTSTNK